jgi:hypothetical protein
MRYLVSVLFLLALAGGPAIAATYYVSTSGSDSNPGTQAQPWATLQKAVDTIASGDTILVTPGTYVGCRIRYSGAAGAPKTLTVQTAGTVLVNAPGPLCRRPSDIEIISEDWGATPTSYWVIDGFEVINSPKWGIDGIRPYNITVRNNVVHNNGTSGTFTGIHQGFCDYALVENNVSYSNSEHGLYCTNSADYGVARRNVLYSNGSEGMHMNGDARQGGDGIMTGWLVEKNIAYNNVNHGYDGDGVEYTTWKNNLAYDNGSKGLNIYQVDGKTNPRYDKVLNNTFVTKPGGYMPLTWLKGRNKVGGNNNSTMNNILYSADYTNRLRGSMGYVSTWMSTFTSDYNVVIDRFGLDDNRTTYTLAQWQSQFGKDLHSFNCFDLTVLFVDPAGKNWHLKSTSPAINAGTTLTDVTDDLEGYPRTAGSYDIGCYEYH